MPDRISEIEGSADVAVPVQQIYINGFQIGLSNADFSFLGLLDNQPNVKINLSYTVAKTLVVKMSEMVSKLEKSTGREIMTTDVSGAGLEDVIK